MIGIYANEIGIRTEKKSTLEKLNLSERELQIFTGYYEESNVDFSEFILYLQGKLKVGQNRINGPIVYKALSEILNTDDEDVIDDVLDELIIKSLNK